MAQISNCCAGFDDLAARLSPELFKALGDPRRVEILVWLAQSCGSRTVGQIAAAFPVDLSVVSRHLAVLRKAGIVDAERRGRHIHYRVRYGELAAVLRSIADAIEACCPTDEAPAPPVTVGGREEKKPRTQTTPGKGEKR